jgi:hypothetical protein
VSQTEPTTESTEPTRIVKDDPLPASLVESELQLIEMRRVATDIEHQIAKRIGGSEWRERAEFAHRNACVRRDKLEIWVAHLRSKDEITQAKVAVEELTRRLVQINQDHDRYRHQLASAQLAIEFMDVAQVALPNATYGRILDRAKTQASTKSRSRTP